MSYGGEAKVRKRKSKRKGETNGGERLTIEGRTKQRKKQEYRGGEGGGDEGYI